MEGSHVFFICIHPPWVCQYLFAGAKGGPILFFDIAFVALFTPWKFNIAPEKWWLEDYFPIGMIHFQGLC